LFLIFVGKHTFPHAHPGPPPLSPPPPSPGVVGGRGFFIKYLLLEIVSLVVKRFSKDPELVFKKMSIINFNSNNHDFLWDASP
jgi:hypothetical protein